MAGSKLDDAVAKAVAKEIAALKKDLGEDLKQALSATLSSAFGDSGFAPIAAGLGNALDSIIAGNKIDARSIANAAAGSLAPQIGNFFNQSTAQLGESLADLLSSAQRNF